MIFALLILGTSAQAIAHLAIAAWLYFYSRAHRTQFGARIASALALFIGLGGAARTCRVVAIWQGADTWEAIIAAVTGAASLGVAVAMLTTFRRGITLGSPTQIEALERQAAQTLAEIARLRAEVRDHDRRRA